SLVIIEGCLSSKQYGQSKLQPRLVTIVYAKVDVSVLLVSYCLANATTSSASLGMIIRPSARCARTFGESGVPKSPSKKRRKRPRSSFEIRKREPLMPLKT